MSVHRRAPHPLNVGLAGPRLADRSVTLSRERAYRLFSTPGQYCSRSDALNHASAFASLGLAHVRRHFGLPGRTPLRQARVGMATSRTLPHSRLLAPRR
jgi:hypothetical protein